MCLTKKILGHLVYECLLSLLAREALVHVLQRLGMFWEHRKQGKQLSLEKSGEGGRENELAHGHRPTLSP